MRTLLSILILSLGLQVEAQINPSNYLATIVFATTNTLGQPDTNYFRIVPIQNPVLANGSIITRGVPFRMYPDTNGICFTNLQQGFYQMTNAFLNAGIIFYVPGNTNSYTVSTALPPPPGQLAISGFNTYALSGVLGLTSSNGTVSLIPPNGVGWVDIEAGNATNGSFTNLVTLLQTNSIFINTNVFISTSNSFFNNTVITNVSVTNLTVINETNNTFVNTNVSIFNSNSFFNNTVITNLNVTNETFNVSKGGTLIVTNASFTYVTNQNEITTNAYIQNITNNISYITNLFVTQLIGTTNSNFLLRTNDFGTNEGFVGTTSFYAAPGATNPATLVDFFDWTGTNINAGFDGTNWFGTLTNLVAGANITLTPHGSGSNWSVTIAASGTFSGNVYASNVISGGVLSTNVEAANNGVNGFILGQSNAVPVWTVNAGSLTNLNGANIQAGTVANAALANSTIGINGTANQITSSSSSPALGGSTTLAIANPLLAPGPISTSGFTNSNDAASQFKITDSGKGEQTTLNGGTLTNLNGQAITGAVSFVQWDASAFMTNSAFNSNNLAYVTQGAASGALQGSSTAPMLMLPLSSVQGGTNQFFTQWYPPPGIANAVGTYSVLLCLATNTVSVKTQIVVSVSASANGTALGGTLTQTNLSPGGTGFISTNISLGPFTISGSPGANTPIEFQVQVWWPALNGICTNASWAFGSRWTYTNSATQNGLLTGW